MYSNDRTFGIRDIIVKIIFLALFVLLMIWLMPKVPNMTPFYSNVFRENISYMQDAARSYFTTDKLPSEIGGSRRLTLKEMQDMKLIIPFVDKDGKSCNLHESYAEVIKEEKGYSLKVQLNCNTESDYIIEILGCYDYGCDTSCSPTDTPKQTAIEYQFKKSYSKKVTNCSCPSGYKKDGNYCYKNEIVDATKNYKDDTLVTKEPLYNLGEARKVYYDKTTTTKTVQDKKYFPMNTVEEKVGSCVDKKIADPSCKVKCEQKFANGVFQTVCNTCGTVTIKDCSSVKTITKTNCNGYAGQEGSQCYNLVSRTETSYSCPSGTQEEGGGSSLKCYKMVYDKEAYCEDAKFELNEKTNKCEYIKKGEFSHYSCPGKHKIDGSKCTLLIDKQKTSCTTSTKTWSETKWSKYKSLIGWTATGKTRIVEK